MPKTASTGSATTLHFASPYSATADFAYDSRAGYFTILFKRGMQAERGCRRDTEHEPQAVGGDKPDAVNVISQPIRVFTHQSGSILAVSLAYSTRISFAQADVAQPRVDIRDGCHLSERLVDRVCASRRDALDRTQVLRTLAL